MIVRDMVDANYPLRLGTMDELNEKGDKLVYTACHDASVRFELEECDEVTKAWKTFRDQDRSLITGTKSVPLKGKWLEKDDEGNPTINK